MWVFVGVGLSRVEIVRLTEQWADLPVGSFEPLSLPGRPAGQGITDPDWGWCLWPVPDDFGEEQVLLFGARTFEPSEPM
ncbi:hypothetical protein GCM10009838_67600 [Catenulispora subtropica]|uniref:Uncharacterized protein n=1 Tax=Catenulispora subtropica TaxID=450798 RepID=A0ABP5E9H2_9ACTN